MFNMSKKVQSIHLLDCVLPDLSLDHLLKQIATSSTLTRINLWSTSLQDIQSLCIQYLPSLTYLRLCDTNLCHFHIFHLGYLIENRKLPQLSLLSLRANNLSHLEGDMDVFLKLVAKHHQRNITVVIQDCCLPTEFFQRIAQYTKSPSRLRIHGDTGDDNIINIQTNVEESQEVTGTYGSDIYKKILATLETDETLQVVSLRDSNLPQQLCGPILQDLSSHISITCLDLSGNTLGIHGVNLVNTINTWGTEPSLQELDLSHCSLPVEVCGPLLSALGRCRKLTELWLPGNTLTGCLGHFLAQPNLTLPCLEELFLSYTKLNAQDLLHLAELIRTEKIPKLKELDLGANELHRMEEPLDELLQALVDHHHTELKLNIYFNRLKQGSVQRMKFLCENTDIELKSE